MKDDERAQGFSFHLSASAPPAEVSERAPDSGPSWFAPGTDRLDLNLDAFAASAPAPEVAADASPEVAADASPEVAADAAPEVTADAAPEVTADAAPAPRHEAPAPLAAPAPRVLADEVTRTPAPVDATSPPPPATHAPRGVTGPAVRSIRFPSAGPNARTSTGRRSETVFSNSLSQAPRARLESDDDNELEAEAARDALPPEDLPEPAPQSLPRRTALRASPAKPRAPELSTLSELARQGAALGRRGTQQGARLALLTSTRALELWQQGRTRALAALAERRTARASAAGASRLETSARVAAPTASVSSGDAAGSNESPDQLPQAPSRLSADRRSPWISGGAALMAAGICYFGASRLVVGHGEAAQPPAAELAGEQAPESDGPAEIAAAVPALAKTTPASGAAQAETAMEKAAPEPEDAENTPPPRKTSAAPASIEAALEMPEGLSWPGKGLIEVVTEARELVYVDGVFTGRGPLRRIPIQPGSHEVVVRTEGQERAVRLDVSTGKRARVVFGS